MDSLQARKLDVIEYLKGLTDENVFKVIEEFVNKSKSGKVKTYEPYTVDEMVSRAAEANADYLAGNYKSQDDLEKESENW